MHFGLSLIVLAAGALQLGATGSRVCEYQVKAAFLYNFAKFVIGRRALSRLRTTRSSILHCRPKSIRFHAGGHGAGKKIATALSPAGG